MEMVMSEKDGSQCTFVVYNASRIHSRDRPVDLTIFEPAAASPCPDSSLQKFLRVDVEIFQRTAFDTYAPDLVV